MELASKQTEPLISFPQCVLMFLFNYCVNYIVHNNPVFIIINYITIVSYITGTILYRAGSLNHLVVRQIGARQKWSRSAHLISIFKSKWHRRTGAPSGAAVTPPDHLWPTPIRLTTNMI